MWLFVAFYGYTFVISNEGMDANRYRDQLILMGQSELSFDNFTSLLYSEETKYVDILQPLISFTVSLFTTDYKILFLVFAIIFGFFYSRNIWYLIRIADFKVKKEYIPLIITFAFIIGFWQINGFRMWTAAHIFFFGTIQYFFEGKSKGLLLAAFSVLVHFSFALPLLVIIVYILFKNRVHLYFVLFVLSFFLTEINLGAVRNVLIDIVPNIFSASIESYTNEDYANRINESLQSNNWYALYYVQALKWVIALCFGIVYIKSIVFIKNHKYLFSLYSFTLLFLTVANVMSLIPSGGRFISVANLFAIAFIISFLHQVPKEHYMRRLQVYMIPALVFYCIVSFRLGLDTIGMVTVLGNPVISIFFENDSALVDLIK
ncbi:hypothetical protein GCM10027293_34930 [Pontibacter aydingkolensis]